MRVMVIVKADKNSEAGAMPNKQLLTDMGKFNEELVKGAVLLAGDGLHPTSKGKRVKFSGQQRAGRRPLCGNQGIDRRLLAVAGEVHRRRGAMAQARAV
jgi:hypothetical protein